MYTCTGSFPLVTMTPGMPAPDTENKYKKDIDREKQFKSSNRCLIEIFKQQKKFTNNIYTPKSIKKNCDFVKGSSRDMLNLLIFLKGGLKSLFKGGVELERDF